MAGGFTKFHQSILDSSIWLESHPTRVVWFTMLLMCDADGVVQASVGGLAHRSRVTKEECQHAIEVLAGPDADSRDGTTGERIERVPGGWLILNYANYRDRQTKQQAQVAERVRRHREGRNAERVADRYEALQEPCNAISPLEAEAEAEVQKSTRPRSSPRAARAELPPGFAEFWDAYAKKVGRPPAERAWRKLNPDAALAAELVIRATAYAKSTPDAQFRRHPATWLNQRGWEDEFVPATTAPPPTRAERAAAASHAPQQTRHNSDLELGDPRCDCLSCRAVRRDRGGAA